MKCAVSILVSFIFCLIVSAQNLVPNPSFEIYDRCPNNYTSEPKKILIPEWHLPTRGTSDYFNSCTKIQVSVPNNFIGNMFAKDGQAYVGMILLEKPSDIDKKGGNTNNYREYIQAKLKEPLIPGEKYLVSFHYAIATYSTYAVNNIGIYFSQDPIKKRLSSNTLNCVPQIQADSNIICTVKDTWIEVLDTLTATSNENYITIGNFYSTPKTQYKVLDTSNIRNTLREQINENRIAYYYIDDISVIRIDY